MKDLVYIYAMAFCYALCGAAIMGAVCAYNQPQAHELCAPTNEGRPLTAYTASSMTKDGETTRKLTCFYTEVPDLKGRAAI